MAKRRPPNSRFGEPAMPAILDHEPAEYSPAAVVLPGADSAPAAAEIQASPAVSIDAVRSVMLELPMRRTKGYAARRLRALSGPEARTLRDLADGLAAEGITIGGKAIESGDDALSWLLGKISW